MYHYIQGMGGFIHCKLETVNLYAILQFMINYSSMQVIIIIILFMCPLNLSSKTSPLLLTSLLHNVLLCPNLHIYTMP